MRYICLYFLFSVNDGFVDRLLPAIENYVDILQGTVCKYLGYRVLTTLENMGISGNLLILENSGKTQGI